MHDLAKPITAIRSFGFSRRCGKLRERDKKKTMHIDVDGGKIGKWPTETEGKRSILAQTYISLTLSIVSRYIADLLFVLAPL